MACTPTRFWLQTHPKYYIEYSETGFINDKLSQYVNSNFHDLQEFFSFNISSENLTLLFDGILSVIKSKKASYANHIPPHITVIDVQCLSKKNPRQSRYPFEYGQHF